jgi:hypothetical protein
MVGVLVLLLTETSGQLTVMVTGAEASLPEFVSVVAATNA